MSAHPDTAPAAALPGAQPLNALDALNVAIAASRAAYEYEDEKSFRHQTGVLLTRRQALDLAARLQQSEREREAAHTCSGCGAPRSSAIRAVLDGMVACCPDCSTLTMEERNMIRAALASPLTTSPESDR